MMGAYYNEIDPYAAQWLRNLIKAGHITDGEVDERSIVDVSPDDLRGFTQCHFFAGIGGWSHALRLAGWSDDRPIWTGSCPCQPFSVAGKGAGTDDPRHLWPHFHRLITAVRPPVVMGEQVAGAAGYGWLDGVRSDLEREGYASRGIDIPACAMDAPHIRQRLYWIACDMDHANNTRLERYAGNGDGGKRRTPKDGSTAQTGGGNMADSQNNGSSFGPHFDARGPEDERCRDDDIRREHIGFGSSVCSAMEDANGIGWAHGEYAQNGREARTINQSSSGNDGDMADASLIKRDGGGCGDNLGAWRGIQGQARTSDSHMADANCWHGECGQVSQSAGLCSKEAGKRPDNHVSGRCASFWFDAIWLTGSDGKARRAKPGLPLLAHGVSNRVGRLRAYGNAIVPPLAAEVIRAFMETEEGNT